MDLISSIRNRLSVIWDWVKLKLHSIPILLILAAAFSLSISISAAEIDWRLIDIEPSLALGLFFILIFFISIIIPILVVGVCTYLAFNEQRVEKQLGVFLLVYCVVILSFTGYYYSITYIEDYNDCRLRYNEYKYKRRLAQILNTVPSYDKITSNRAFSGMKEKFWQLGEFNDTVSQEIRDIDDILKHPSEKVIYPTRDSKIPIFIDCFHFSVVSMTLFGYGTVTPLDLKIKFGNSLQVLTGTLLLVVLLGMLLSGRLRREIAPKDNTEHGPRR